MVPFQFLSLSYGSLRFLQVSDCSLGFLRILEILKVLEVSKDSFGFQGSIVDKVP